MFLRGVKFLTSKEMLSEHNEKVVFIKSDDRRWYFVGREDDGVRGGSDGEVVTAEVVGNDGEVEVFADEGDLAFFLAWDML